MIEIDINPYIIGGISWHGLFTALGVAFAVFGVARLGRNHSIDPQIVYSCAMWAIPGGIVGSRIVHVIDNWDFYANNPERIFFIWSGGVGLFGALLGGTITGVAWAFLNRQPIGKLADLAAPMMLVAQAIGRFGDIINGEHFSKITSLPWAWVHTHPDWPGLGAAKSAIPLDKDGLQVGYHPAVAYEMVADIVLFFFILRLVGRIKPDGMVMISYLALYSMIRFVVQFSRDDPQRVGFLQQAHIIALIVMAVTVVLGIIQISRRDPSTLGKVG